MTWVRIPPSEPGFYWARDSDADLRVIEHFTQFESDDWNFPGTDVVQSTEDMLLGGWEWWSERIEEPAP